jgi:ABC-2 type transport system permease protein
MRKVLVIALREYNAAVRTKAFLIGLLIMPILMGASVVMQWLLKDLRDTNPKKFAVINRTRRAEVGKAVREAVDKYNKGIKDSTGKPFLPEFDVRFEKAPGSDTEADQLRARLSDEVRAGTLFGILEIGSDVLELSKPEEGKPVPDSRKVRYQSNRPTNQDFVRVVMGPLRERVRELRSREAGVDPKKVEMVAAGVESSLKGLSKRQPDGSIEDATDKGFIAPFAVPFVLMLMMFMMLMMTATPQMQGVVEEKMQRIAEVLLGSVQPFQLMLGKIIGMTGVALTIAAVYLGGGYWAAHRYGFAEYVPASLLAWFLAFQVLASLMYGSLFIAVGAACTDAKETQNLMWPVMMLAMWPLFVLGYVIQEPNSNVSTALSFVPFGTPMLMIARQAVPPGVPWWQPPLGMVLVVATTLLCVYAAGRIFRVGILLQGKGARLGEIVRWVFRG